MFNSAVHEEEEVLEFNLNSGITVSQRKYNVYDEQNKLQGALWFFEDVTSDRQTARQLVYLAEHD